MDIKANINYSLEGKFKVDIYKKDGTFIESSDWFNNFITPTGLSYIYRYKFADCFKFLSLGTGFGTQNYGNAILSPPPGQEPTTGLASPIVYKATDFSTGTLGTSATGLPGILYTGTPFVGTQSLQYMGSWGYADTMGNSIVEQPEGPRFYRTWKVPAYDATVVTGGDLTIGEFMVSPSSGSDLLGNKAFSRVRKNIIIPDQTYAYVTYQLGIRLSSSTIQIMTGGTFNTGNAEVSYERNEVKQWADLSGYYRQTYHGLAWIDVNGDTFVPKYGAIMEPSWTGMDECRFYLSPDNGQFNVSTSGGAQLSESAAYAADGLLRFVREIPFAEASPAPDYDAEHPQNPLLPQNIRYSTQTKTPYLYNYADNGENDLSILKSDDYQSFSMATPGVNQYATGVYSDSSQFGNKVLISTKGFNLPVTGSQTGRSRTLTRRHSFMPSQSMGKNTRYGSLVYAFNHKGSSPATYYPMIDCMFFDSSGQYIMAHYRQITGIYFTNRGSGILDAFTFTTPTLDMPFTHRTFQGPGTGDLNNHPALNLIS